MNDLIKYRKDVETKAVTHSSDIIFNTGPEEAKITLSTLFKFSKNQVRLYCGGFKSIVPDDDGYCFEVRAFLEGGGNLKVMTEGNIRTDAKLYRIISSERYNSKNRSEILAEGEEKPQKLGSVEIIEGVGTMFNNNGQNYHFAIGDNQMYRIEMMPDSLVAQVCFNDEKTCQALGDYFDIVFSQKLKGKAND